MRKTNGKWGMWFLIVPLFLAACNLTESPTAQPAAASPTEVVALETAALATATLAATTLAAPAIETPIIETPIIETPVLESVETPTAEVALGDTPYSLDNCAAATGTSVVGDQIFDNVTLCYQARAAELNDWSSCLHLPHEPSAIIARCLVDVGWRTSVYLCAQPDAAALVHACNQLLMTEHGLDPALHLLGGIDAYRVEHQRDLAPGADLNVPGQPPQPTAEGLVSIADYHPTSTHVCHPQEAPPLAVGTGVVGAYIYITGCTVSGETINIAYFKYDLPGILFPENM